MTPVTVSPVRKTTIGQSELGILARMLRQVDFFSALTVGQLDQVLPYIALYSCEAGETIFKQGEAGDAFYIVYKGRVSVRVKKSLLSLACVVAELGPGGFFGEIALVSKQPRTATIVCEEPTDLFALLPADFAFVLRENPGVAAQMRRIADRRRFDTHHA